MNRSILNCLKAISPKKYISQETIQRKKLRKQKIDMILYPMQSFLTNKYKQYEKKEYLMFNQPLIQI